MVFRMSHKKPRVMLIDVDPSVQVALQNAGYEPTIGSFGFVCEVARGNHLLVVPKHTASCEDIGEMEVIIVDLSNPPIGDSDDLISPAEGVEYTFTSAHLGLIDPRPLVAQACSGLLHRISNFGGIFVVLMGPNREVTYVTGTIRHLDSHSKKSCSFGGIIPSMQRIDFLNRTGNEILYSNSELGRLIKAGSEGASYQAVMQFGWKDDWQQVAQNKYGETVAALYAPDGRPSTLLLHRMPRLADVVVELFEEHLSTWNPSLFPNLTRFQWLHSPEYEIPEVIAKSREIETTVDTAKERVQLLENDIARIRHEQADRYQLLSGTDDALVRSVMSALQVCGFTQVVHMDSDADSDSRSLREDIQIRDRSPTLVVDVKGISGTPTDEASLQASKHAYMRIVENDRPDFRGLTIINHERHRPPHERNSNPFRAEIVASASVSKLGLMTSWDLFRIVENAVRLKWPRDSVAAMFYKHGLIGLVPTHYIPVGQVVKVFPDKQCIGVVPNMDIEANCILAFQFENTFEHFTAKSLMTAGAKEQLRCEAGSNCGIRLEPISNVALFPREKMDVFVVSQ
jgi:hypothetical protein